MVQDVTSPSPNLSARSVPGPMSVLLFVADPQLRGVLAEFLSEKGDRVSLAADLGDALQRPSTESYELCILEAESGAEPGSTAAEHAVGAIRAQDPRVEIVVVTEPRADSGASLIALGARAVVPRPVDLRTLALLQDSVRADFAARREILSLEHELAEKFTFEGMVSRSQSMLDVFHTIRAIALSDVTVLVTGETGTGKELAAGAIHRLSARAKKKFVVSNCAALPESLAESELFGHVKGAFTGATESRAGIFERANGGTVFLDEVGELPLPLQAKLLRAVQQGEIQKVGGGDPIHVDTRLITATNRDLRTDVSAGRFREDLYYRLAVLEIRLPPLRDRREDITLLYRKFLQEFNARSEKRVRGFSKRAQEAFMRWPWPGNVRELQNVIERACVLAQRDFVDLEELPAHLQGGAPAPAESTVPLDLTLEEVERQHIGRVLAACNGNRTTAAIRLGISRRTLQRKLQEMGEPAETPLGWR